MNMKRSAVSCAVKKKAVYPLDIPRADKRQQPQISAPQLSAPVSALARRVGIAQRISKVNVSGGSAARIRT